MNPEEVEVLALEFNHRREEERYTSIEMSMSSVTDSNRKVEEREKRMDEIEARLKRLEENGGTTAPSA